MGDQPQAIAELTAGVRDGRRSQVLLGVTGSGKTFTMANVIAELGRPALIMAPNKILAAQLYTEMKSFFQQTMWNTLYHTMTIISQRRICQQQTHILTKTHP